MIEPTQNMKIFIQIKEQIQIMTIRDKATLNRNKEIYGI